MRERESVIERYVSRCERGYKMRESDRGVERRERWEREQNEIVSERGERERIERIEMERQM